MTNPQLKITAFGGPENLVYSQQAMPTIGPHQVLIKVDVAGVNPVDAKTRAGLGWAAAKFGDQLPWTPGFECAGVIEQLGSDVSCRQLGERVAVMTLEGGCYGGYLAIDAAHVMAIPDNVSQSSAAAVMLAGQTAMQALALAEVSEDDTVAILAGAGGVGHIAIQLASTLGCTVYATASEAKQQVVASFGAKPLNYQTNDQPEQPVDVLIDLMGGEVGMAALAWVKPNGRVVTIPTVTAPQICQSASELGIEANGMLVSPNVVDGEQLLTYLASGLLHVHIDDEIPLQEGERAHRMIETGRTLGKLVLTL